jgi:O-acetyl-ADP-ribose deacetylase (regulator of RNase III)
LETAAELRLTIIAFPAIGSGLAELSFGESARSMCGAIIPDKQHLQLSS